MKRSTHESSYQNLRSYTFVVLIDLQDRTFSLHKERKYKPLAWLWIPHTKKSGLICFYFLWPSASAAITYRYRPTSTSNTIPWELTNYNCLLPPSYSLKDSINKTYQWMVLGHQGMPCPVRQQYPWSCCFLLLWSLYSHILACSRSLSLPSPNR